MAVSGLEMSHSIATYVISSKKKMMFLIQNVFEMSSGCSLTSFVIWCFYSSLTKTKQKGKLKRVQRQWKRSRAPIFSACTCFLKRLRIQVNFGLKGV